MKVLLKACPRCGGDLIPDEGERDSQSMACLQCGATFHASHLPRWQPGQTPVRRAA